MMNSKLMISAILSLFLISAMPYTDWKEWISSDQTMSIKYPSDWNFNPSFPGTIFSIKTKYSDDKDFFREFLTLIIEPVDADKNLDNFVDDILKRSGQSFENVQLVSKNKTTVSGNPAYEIVFTGTQMDLELQWRHTIFLKNQQAYMLNYSAEKINYEKYTKEVDEMISSFILK